MKKGKLLMTLLALALFVSSCEMTPEKIEPFNDHFLLESEEAATDPGEPLPPPD